MMRSILALAVTTMMAISVPAFAQSAGAPGAIGTGGGLTGSNPPGGGVDRYSYVGNRAYGARPGYYDNGYYGPRSQPSWSVDYNRQGLTAGWSAGYGTYAPGPNYNDYGYYGQPSQPSWSVFYNRQGS